MICDHCTTPFLNDLHTWTSVKIFFVVYTLCLAEQLNKNKNKKNIIEKKNCQLGHFTSLEKNNSKFLTPLKNPFQA